MKDFEHTISWKTCFKVCFSVLVLFICVEYFKVGVNLIGLLMNAAAPLLAGGVIAYFLNIIMSFYERHYFANSKNSKIIKSRRVVCMLLAIISLVAVIVLIFYLVVPQLAACIKLVFAELPAALKNGITELGKLNILSENVVEKLYAIDWQAKIKQFMNVLASGIGNALEVIADALSGIVTFFIGFIFAIYILLGKDKLSGQFYKLFNCFIKEKKRNEIKHYLSLVNDCFHKYIVGQCTEAVILGILCMLGMLLLRLPYATMVGALIGFTALIPVAGAYIGAGIGAFMIFTVSPVKALIFLIFIVILQQLEGNLIYPKVVGSSLGLPAIWVLAAVTIGGGLMGIAGMLLAVPVTAAIYSILGDRVNKKPITTK